MDRVVLSEGNINGYGLTREDALEDLFFNKCRIDISNDVNGVFKKRREFLKPWRPRPNMLHIHSVGCLNVVNNKVIEVSTGKTVEVTDNPQAIYYYIANLFGKKLSYTDISIVLQKDLDDLFKVVNKDIITISSMPEIKLMSSVEGFEPIVTYNTKASLIIGVSNRAIGVKEIGDDYYHVVEFVDMDVTEELISYVCYKLGYVFNGKFITEVER